MTSETGARGHEPASADESDPELHARQASSFGAAAAAYDEHRPDYPGAAVSWALQPCDGPRPHVLDLAAGTGKLTGVLLRLGCRVTAVEPDPGMLAALARRHPEATALRGSAEEIPVDRAGVDAVLVAQAFHWFDLPHALAEIARVLRPGGVLGALWNRDDERVDWVNEMAALAGASTGRDWTGTQEVAAHPDFTAVEEATFDHTQRRTAESMTATVGTYSALLVADPERRAAVLGRVLEYLRSHPETGNGEFDRPIRTYTFRAQRR